MSFCRFFGAAYEPLTERHVQAIWYDREMRPERLVTREGLPIRVVHPGNWNLGPGPDFTDAVLEIGPEHRRICGDVEVHLAPGDWQRHGHGSDPAYRRVVAHVTWGCGPEPPSLPSAAVSIWLGRFMTALPGFTPEQIDLSAYPFARLPMESRPCFEALRNDRGLSLAALSAAGMHRLCAKGRRMATLMMACGDDSKQLFYEEVMTALGYRYNARAFRRVAARVPYAQITAEPENAVGALTAAGAFESWNRRGLRPHNAPEVRLASAAAIFTKTRIMDLLTATCFAPRDCREMMRLMVAGHWMGRGRAAAILANVIVPFARAAGRISRLPEWLPPEDVSEPVHLTAFRLFGRDHNPSVYYAGNGLHIQGLIQIHREFCLQVHPDCGGCGFVANLRRARHGTMSL